MKYTAIVLVAFLAQAAFAQEEQTGADVRFVGLAADYGTGVMSQSDQPDIWGDKMGLGAAMALGSYRGKPVFLEFGRSVFEGDTQSRTTRFLAEGTPFVLATTTSPNGNLSLNSSTDETGALASALVTLTVASGGDASIESSTFSPPGGQTSVWAYSPTDTGGLFTSLVTDGTRGIATTVGMIFDETGAVLMTEGTARQVPVTSTRSDRVVLTDSSVRLSTAILMENGWNVFPRGGLIRRSLKRATVLTQTIDIQEGFAVDIPAPAVSIVQDTDLRVDMTGISVGTGLSRPLSDQWRVSFGADIGLLRAKSQFSSYEVVQLDAQDLQQIAGPRDKDNPFVQMGRVSFSLSRQLNRNAVLSLNLYSDAMTGVPYLEQVMLDDLAPAQSDGGEDTILVVAGENNRDLQFRYGNLRSSGLSLSLVWMF